MPTPITGDNFSSQRDVNSSPSERQALGQHTSGQIRSPSPSRDSVQVRPSHLDEPVRPLSDNIRSAEQAKARVQQLLTSFQSAPETAINAQTSPSQAHAETLLQTPG